MHLLTSRAEFNLLSPLPHTTIYITSLHAAAFYAPPDPPPSSGEAHPELVGTINYTLPFAVPPGLSTTPPLPVDWSLGGAGYGAVKDALGGTLQLSAKADVGVRIGAWSEEVWFASPGMGAKVRL